MTPRLLIGLTVAVLACTFATVPAAADAAPMGPVVACSTAQLRPHLVVGRQDATDQYPFVVLTDQGGTCVLRGRPTVALEHAGRPVDRVGQYFPYSPNGGRPRTGAVTVRHRGEASIWLAVAVAAGAHCRKQPVDGFLVTLPHGSRTTVALPRRDRSRFTVCASRSSEVLDVSQFLAGGPR